MFKKKSHEMPLMKAVACTTVYTTEVMTSQKTVFLFQYCEYPISVEQDVKPPQPKFGGNYIMGAPWYNSYEPGQFTLLSMGLIRNSCGQILGPHESIHVKFGVRIFHHVVLKYGMKMLKCKKQNLMTSHFRTLCHNVTYHSNAEQANWQLDAEKHRQHCTHKIVEDF